MSRVATQLMDGISVSKQLLADVTGRTRRFLDTAGRRPCLAAVLIGDEPASVTYVTMKRNRCEKTGIDSRLVELPAVTSTSEAVSAVQRLSADPGVDGILVQHPVPPQVDERAVFEAITPAKDVDGVTMHSFAVMPSVCPDCCLARLVGSSGSSTLTRSTSPASTPWS